VARVRRGGRVRIVLRGLPHGAVRVRAVVRTRGGRRVVRVRTFHLCVKR